jgi:hypothetical protein
MLPNLSLLDRPNTTKQIKIFNNAIREKDWTALKGPDWPQTLTEFLQGNQTLSTIIEKEIDNLCKTEISITDDEFSFLEKNLNLYTQINSQLSNLVKDGFLVTGIPVKLQTLKEKKLIVKNFNHCVNWYNNWVKENNFGKIYSPDELDKIMSAEDQKLNFQVDQQMLLQ